MRKVLIAAVVVLILGTGATARQPEEAILGEVAAGLVGSFAGLYLGSQASMLLDDSAAGAPRWIHQVSSTLPFAGIVVGACGGVVLAGTLLAVDGNLPLCLLGGCLGLGAGALVSIPIYALFGADVDVLLLPAAAAALAVWGFNVGATSR